MPVQAIKLTENSRTKGQEVSFKSSGENADILHSIGTHLHGRRMQGWTIADHWK